MFLFSIFGLSITLVPFVASYDFFFLYGDRDHNMQIDTNDIKKIRNPAWQKEWNSFDINKFLPISEFEMKLFLSGND